MPLLKPTEKIEKTQLRIAVDKNLLEQMKQYCDWAGIKKVDDFVEQAALLVFAKDKDWRTKNES